jgi:hypothetical protein
MLNASSAPTKIKHVANPIISQKQMKNAHNDAHYAIVKNFLQFFYDILVSKHIQTLVQIISQIVFT